MALSKAFTTVTPFSKVLSIFLFISLPFLGFYLGMLFQQSITPQYPPLQYDPAVLAKPVKMNTTVGNPAVGTEPAPIRDLPQKTPENQMGTICTQDAKQCPDGSWVGRTGTKCEFICPAAQ